MSEPEANRDPPAGSRMDAEAADDLATGETGLLSHLVELRSRLMRAALAVVGVFLVLTPFSNRLYALLARPLLQHLPEGTEMIAIDVASPFIAPLKLTFFAAIVIAMPVVLYQIWAFVAPGLYRREQRLARPLLLSSLGLFYLGCAFAYALVLPAAFRFFTAVAPAGVSVMTDINRYLDFVLALFLAFGLCFEVPIAVVILVSLGIVDVATLRRGRAYVVVGAFVVGAVLTPPDVISQIMLAIPVWLLFEAGIIAAALLTKAPPATIGE